MKNRMPMRINRVFFEPAWMEVSRNVTLIFAVVLIVIGRRLGIIVESEQR